MIGITSGEMVFVPSPAAMRGEFFDFSNAQVIFKAILFLLRTTLPQNNVLPFRAENRFESKIHRPASPLRRRPEKASGTPLNAGAFARYVAMSLGVLNNLSAIYAENYLSQNNSSLSTVLQQLSSGSRINSGSDDAAGLSLVDGLQTNQQALDQSETNASEGVGLLQVADGALSQVASLLNRAVTLATEASNGTLNTAQDTAANQEYQSILAEISNVGATTAYNDDAVFGSNTNIYTGDSSTAGASIDDLTISALSSANLGDTNGAISYAAASTGGSEESGNGGSESGGSNSSPTNTVFIDLSQGGTLAQQGDALADSSTTIQISYLTSGPGGSLTPASLNVTAGQGTSYNNNVSGLIDAINAESTTTGVSASFGTATQAGTQAVEAAGASNAGGGSGADTGIILSGADLGVGSESAGELGSLQVTTAADTLTGGTLTVVDSSGNSHSIGLGTPGTSQTLAQLQSTVNGLDAGVYASLSNNNTELDFYSESNKASVSADSQLTYVTSSQTVGISDHTAGNIGYFVFANPADTLSGTFTGTDKAGNNFSVTLNASDDTMATFAAALNAGGAYASLGINAQVSGDELIFSKRAGDADAPWLTPGQDLTETGAIPEDASILNAPSGSPTASTEVDEIDFSGLSNGSPGLTTGSISVGYNQTIQMDASDTSLNAIAQTIDNAGLGITATVDVQDSAIDLYAQNSDLVVFSNLTPRTGMRRITEGAWRSSEQPLATPSHRCRDGLRTQ